MVYNVKPLYYHDKTICYKATHTSTIYKAKEAQGVKKLHSLVLLSYKGEKIWAHQEEMKSNDIGLYQIYGTHHVYGSNVLLYINRTTDQNFGSRLDSCEVITENQDSNNIKIYVGRIFSDMGKMDNLSERIKWAEAILIHSHAPAKNSSNISGNRIYYTESIHVLNYNNYRDLLPEVSSKRWYSTFKNIEILKKIATHYKCKIQEDENNYGVLIDNGLLWFGIDNELWDTKQVSLSYGLQNDDELFNKFKKYSKKGELYTYTYDENKEDNPYYFVNIDLEQNLSIEEHVETIISELDTIIKALRDNP